MAKAAELLGLSGRDYGGIAGMLFVPAYKMQLAEHGFPRDHHMENTDVEVAIDALYNAVRLQEELEEQGLGE
jgi:hypothetical protein